MPELSRVYDPFSNAVKAFMFGEPQTNGNEFNDERNPTRQRFCNPDFARVDYKPVHHGDDQRTKVTETSSDHSLLDLDMFMRPTYFPPTDPTDPTESDLNKLQQPGYVYSPFGDNQNYPPLHLDVPEIDECIPWMPEILEDFLPFNTQELPTLSSVGNVTFDLIPPQADPSDFSPPVSLPISHPASTPSTTTTPSTSKTPALPSPTTPSPTGTLPLPSPGTPSTSRTPRVSSPTLPQPTTPPTSRPSGVPTPSTAMPISEEVLTTPVSQTSQALKPRGSQIRKTPRGPKKTTNVEQLEHVKRERKRRDDMSFKISTLESLLPPVGPNMKRDRASIVHDSVHYVRSLQQELDELKKKHSELELRKGTEGLQITTMIPNEKQSPPMAMEEKGAKLMEYHIQVDGDTESAARLEKCRCRPDHMSRAMKVMEQLNLDVRRCTITKMYSYSMCLIMAKQRLPSNPPMSSASVVAALRSSITLG